MSYARRALGTALMTIGTVWLVAALGTIATHLAVSHQRVFGPTWPAPIRLDAAIVVLSVPGLGILALGTRIRRSAVPSTSASEPTFGVMVLRSAFGAILGAACFIGAALVLVAAAAIGVDLDVDRWIEAACWIGAIAGALVGVLAASR